MTPIHRELIAGLALWRRADFHSKDDFAFDLIARHSPRWNKP